MEESERGKDDFAPDTNVCVDLMFDHNYEDWDAVNDTVEHISEKVGHGVPSDEPHHNNQVNECIGKLGFEMTISRICQTANSVK
jgi:hypothetical protein